MAYTFNDMTFLTAPQKAAAQALADAVAAASAGGPGFGESGTPFAPPLSLSNTKRAAELLRELDALWRPVRMGVQRSIDFYQKDALKTLDTNNP